MSFSISAVSMQIGCNSIDLVMHNLKLEVCTVETIMSLLSHFCNLVCKRGVLLKDKREFVVDQSKD